VSAVDDVAVGLFIEDCLSTELTAKEFGRVCGSEKPRSGGRKRRKNTGTKKGWRTCWRTTQGFCDV
jgi:hypothetical protein